ncbi:MAG: hypothetical protein WBG90_02940 [Saonia sp.]
MRTRKSFLDWMDVLGKSDEIGIDYSKFYSIHERDYVYRSLDKVWEAHTGIQKFVQDYKYLEDQRYQIIDDHIIDEKTAISQIETAIRFCSKSDEEKRQSTFVMNRKLSNYLVQSSFVWDTITTINPIAKNSHYVVIPSFLSIAPKEIYLSNLNAVLLDIKDYTETFSYKEFFELVSDTLELGAGELDKVLMEFISNQVLYYRTMLPVH